MVSGDRVTQVSREVWDRLAAQRPTGDALVARAAIPASSPRLLAAIDRESKRHFLIQLQPSDPAYGDDKSRGLGISTRELRLEDGAEGRYLDIICREAIGHELFNSLGGELAMVLIAGVEEPIAAVARLVSKWRRFWASVPQAALTREEEVGLFAELWFLAYWLAPRIGISRALLGWRGPVGARHDIELAACSFEVKATTAAAGRIHHVHGIEQLAAPERGQLFLFSLAVRDEGGGANTLAGLVERIRELASEDDEAIVRFETTLARARYSSDVERESNLRLRVVDELLYSVEGAFPRLLPESFVGGLPAGVLDVTYRIDLSSFVGLVIARNPGEFDRLAIE